MKKNVPVLLIASITVLFLASCATTSIPLEDDQFIPTAFAWQNSAAGIDRYDFSSADIPLRYHVVRINLDEPGIGISAYPNKETTSPAAAETIPPAAISDTVNSHPVIMPQPFVFSALKTRMFAAQRKSAVTINTTPFDYTEKDGTHGTAASPCRTLVGIHYADGILFSTPVARYCALLFIATGTPAGQREPVYRAQIVEHQSSELPPGTVFAFGGFYMLLKNSEARPFPTVTYAARIGAGIDSGGRTLYLLCVERSRASRGLSYGECTRIFSALGCTDAMEFDGGRSSELCINGQSVFSPPPSRIQAASLSFIAPEK